MQHEPYCIYPWFHQKIEVNGSSRPCCAWIPDQHAMQIDSHDFMQGSFMQDLRQKMLSHDIPDECFQCVKNESYGKFSQRMLGWENAKRYGIDPSVSAQATSYEIDMSNACNLKCRTCNGYRSTKWAADDKALGRKTHGLLDSRWQLSDDDAKTARVFAFMGGEPLMHQDRILDTLERCKHAGSLHQCSITFSTNCTIDFEPRLLDLLLMAESVGVSCSIDGYGVLNDYIRSESTWDKVKNQIAKYDALSCAHAHFHYSIQPTYSIYNFNMLEDLIRYSESLMARPKIDMIYLARPSMMNAAVLPFWARTNAYETYVRLRTELPRHSMLLDGCLRFLADEFDDAHTMNEFKSFNDRLDILRTTRLSDANPELARLLRKTQGIPEPL